uniref:Ankyrin repeat domain-containing protein n=1 Tax=candidate division WOR-3 bacterium TaxID=2052148 RepID=A0A7V6CNA6_UNCW3
MRELLNACKDGDLEKVKQLLESRADVNARNKDGKTALRIALEEGHKEIVKLLKSYGAKE